MARLAYVGTDRQLHLIDADGCNPAQLTLSLGDNPLLLWGRPDLEPKSWAWPTWSPTGDRLACFELPSGDDEVTGEAKLHVVDVTGVRQVELLTVERGVPLYCQWQPDGGGLLLLVQDEDELELQHVRLDRIGQASAVERGVPLFFAWQPDGRRIMVHTASGGDPRTGRLVVRDTEGRLPDEVLPQDPGNYCAPVLLGDHVVHVERRRSHSSLVRTRLDGSEQVKLLEYEGLGAIVPAGAGRVVFSAAPQGEGTPYRGLLLVGDDGTIELSGDECLAFSWSEARGALVYAQVDLDSNCLVWKVVEPGSPPRELTRFWPSREQLFYLRFFDQFVQSHDLVDPSGRWLTFAGHTVEDAACGTEPQVHVIDLDGSPDPVDLAPGLFACFSPVVPDA